MNNFTRTTLRRFEGAPDKAPKAFTGIVYTKGREKPWSYQVGGKTYLYATSEVEVMLGIRRELKLDRMETGGQR